MNGGRVTMRGWDLSGVSYMGDSYYKAEGMATEAEFRDRLQSMGHAIERDLHDNFEPAYDHKAGLGLPNMSFDFEAYVFEIDSGVVDRRGMPGRILVGYIYFGDLGEWAFVDNCNGGLDDAYGFLKLAKSMSPYKWEGENEDT